MQLEVLQVFEVWLCQVCAFLPQILQLLSSHRDIGELVDLALKPPDRGAREFHGRSAVRVAVADGDIGEVLEDAALHRQLVEISRLELVWVRLSIAIRQSDVSRREKIPSGRSEEEAMVKTRVPARAGSSEEG